MAPSGQTTTSTLHALLEDGTLTGAWVLDPHRSSIGLKSRSMWGLVPVKGVFGELSGNGTVSPAGEVTGTLTVASASIDTKSSRRYNHLRSAHFFDSANHPDITFAIEAVRSTEHGATMAGALTVRDCTLHLAFDVAVSVAGGREVQLDGEVHVDRAEVGLTWNPMGMTSMDNALTIHAVFARG